MFKRIVGDTLFCCMCRSDFKVDKFYEDVAPLNNVTKEDIGVCYQCQNRFYKETTNLMINMPTPFVEGLRDSDVPEDVIRNIVEVDIRSGAVEFDIKLVKHSSILKESNLTQ